MGICWSCLEGKDGDNNEPSPETKRKQLAEAAEKRQKNIEGRGVKNPEALKRKQQRQEEIQKKADLNPGTGGSNLKWQVG